MKAIIENNYLNIYTENGLLLGSIKTDLHFKESEIILGEQKFTLVRDEWETTIFENSIEKFHLKTNSFLGNTKVLETGYKITGVAGLKWGTKLENIEGNTILKIRNENFLVENGHYEIEIIDKTVDNFNILLALYGHLYGSSLIKMGVGGAG